MRPVYQIGDKGCLVACLSSMLEINSKYIPNLSNIDLWWVKFISYMCTIPYYYFDGWDKDINKLYNYPGVDGMVIVAVGSCEGEHRHAIIVKNEIVIHDPSPYKETRHTGKNIKDLLS